MEDPMKNNDLKNQTAPKSSEETTDQGGHGGPDRAGGQAKEVLHKTADTVEDAYEKTAQKVGAAYEKIAPSAEEAYEKSARAVNETYQYTRDYYNENPGKTILIALGVGVGVGFLLGSNTRHSRGGRYARPVVTAISDVARAFFR